MKYVCSEWLEGGGGGGGGGGVVVVVVVVSDTKNVHPI